MPSRVAAIHPLWAIEGGRITVAGTDFPIDRPQLPEVRIGEAPARVVYASPAAISAIVPAGLEGGLAFATDGTLFVGDRSGTLFRVDREGHATAFASLLPSIAAFHLAIGPDNAIYVTGPTMSSYDAVYRVTPDGAVTIRYAG